MLTRKTKIALLWPKWGGPVTSINDLVLGLDKSRYEVTFIYLHGPRAGNDLCEKAGYQVIYLTRRPRVRHFSLPILLRLVRILKQQQVDILHCHTHTPAVYGALAVALARTPVLLTHVHGLGRTKNLRRRLANQIVFRRASKIVAVAQAVREDILKTNWRPPRQKIIVLENSVAYERFAGTSVTREQARQHLGLSADAVVYGNIARFGPYKGHDLLIQAFLQVRQTIPQAHLVLVGEGPPQEKLRGEAARSGSDDRIHFLGWRPDVAEILRAMDVFVLPSIASEGMPRAILEAMASAIPCIGTSVGGTPEAIDNPGVGFMIPPRDVSALAGAMLQAARMSPQERTLIGQRAQDRIRRLYSHDVIQEKLRELYEAEYRVAVADKEQACGRPRATPICRK
jgi:glycosyltransferase involved in cell wall biosynthesis